MAKEKERCTTCKGSGQVVIKKKERHEDIYGTCPSCGGSGER